jgi:exonuclease SbcC
MFKRLKIRNFQAHRKLSIDFDKITVLVGDSDKGKSSAIRALRWVCFNRPDGTSFVRQGASVCSVEVELWNGTIIERRRGKNVNEYVLNGSVLKAFGRDVPPMVRDALNVSLVSFQTQHDMPFWLDVSKGAVAKNLNSVVDLEVMDRALSYLSKGLKQHQQRLDHIDHDLMTVKIELAPLKSLKEAQAEFEEIQALAKSVEENEGRIGGLKSLILSIKKVERLASITPPDSTEIDRIQSTTKANSTLIRKLSSLIGNIERVQRNIKQWDHDLKKAPLSTVCPTCGQRVRS